MNAFENVSPDALRAGRADAMDDAVAAALAVHPLDGMETEYPHYQGSVAGPEAPPRPSEKHPVFYGRFDRHSAVHSHWALTRALRLVPDHPDETAIADGIDEPLDAAARRHAEAGAAGVLTDDYAGSHWLSSFALYLLTRSEGGIAPGAG